MTEYEFNQERLRVRERIEENTAYFRRKIKLLKEQQEKEKLCQK